MRSKKWLDDCIEYCEAVIRVMSKYPPTDPDQIAQDAKDLPATRRWLAQLLAERERDYGDASS